MHRIQLFELKTWPGFRTCILPEDLFFKGNEGINS